MLLGYETESGAAFRIRRGRRESWRGPGAAAVAATTAPATTAADARGGTPGEVQPIRKPSRRLVQAALRELGVADRPAAALMVGDQYFTDIASANLAGIRSVKVPTLHRASFPAPVRWSQRLETMLYRLKHGRPRPAGA